MLDNNIATNTNSPVDPGFLAAQTTKKNPFADLAALKLSDTILSSAKETLSKLPVRKPTKQEFFRCHPADNMSLITAIYEDKESREFFLIAPEMRGAMVALDQLTPVKLVLAITRQNVLIMVPAKLPSNWGRAAGGKRASCSPPSAPRRPGRARRPTCRSARTGSGRPSVTCRIPRGQTCRSTKCWPWPSGIVSSTTRIIRSSTSCWAVSRMRPDDNMDGGLLAAVPFRRIWCVDAEYQNANGKIFTLCLVAKELRTGETRRWWRDELLRLKSLPIDTGSDAVFVSYLASAELRCFIELGWPFPDNVLDAFVEHRALTNGHRLPTKNDLLGALALRGLPHIESAQKEAMYKRFLNARVGRPPNRKKFWTIANRTSTGLWR